MTLDHRPLRVTRDMGAVLIFDDAEMLFAGSPDDALAECRRLHPETAAEVRRLAAIAKDWAR